MGMCKNCQNEINSNEKFCRSCGAKNEEYVENDIKKTTDESKNKKAIIIGAAVIAIIVIIIAIIVSTNNNEVPITSGGNKGVNFKKIYNETGDSGYYVTLASDNSYLEIDTNPLDLDDFSSSEAWDIVESVNRELDLPESLDRKMGATRAMDGRMTQEYDDVVVSWTYHPDKGLEVLYEKNR